MSAPTLRQSFLDGYLIAENSMGAPIVGVVCRERNVWRIMRFDVSTAEQPREAFATREDAGIRLLELAAAEQSPPDQLTAFRA